MPKDTHSNTIVNKPDSKNLSDIFFSLTEIIIELTGFFINLADFLLNLANSKNRSL